MNLVQFKTMTEMSDTLKSYCIEAHSKGKSNVATAKELTKKGYRSPAGGVINDTHVSQILCSLGYRKLDKNGFKLKPTTDDVFKTNIASKTDTKFLLIRDIIKSNLLAETKISLIQKMVSP